MLKRIRPIPKFQNIKPNTQFGFREKHSSIHQIHLIFDKIAASFENKYFCPCIFLDVSQAFDRVWHTILLFKLKKFLPAPLDLLTKSYLKKPIILRPSRRLPLVSISNTCRSTSRKRLITRPIQRLHS